MSLRQQLAEYKRGALGKSVQWSTEESEEWKQEQSPNMDSMFFSPIGPQKSARSPREIALQVS